MFVHNVQCIINKSIRQYWISVYVVCTKLINRTKPNIGQVSITKRDDDNKQDGVKYIYNHRTKLCHTCNDLE